MSFYCALILYIQDNKIDSIIPTMVLPTTEIIEPNNLEQGEESRGSSFLISDFLENPGIFL